MFVVNCNLSTSAHQLIPSFGFDASKKKTTCSPLFYLLQSVVLLTRFPFVNLFTKVMELVAPAFFDGDGSAAPLEAACADIDRWPEPVPGHTLTLSVRRHSFQVDLP